MRTGLWKVFVQVGVIPGKGQIVVPHQSGIWLSVFVDKPSHLFQNAVNLLFLSKTASDQNQRLQPAALPQENSGIPRPGEGQATDRFPHGVQKEPDKPGFPGGGPVIPSAQQGVIVARQKVVIASPYIRAEIAGKTFSCLPDSPLRFLKFSVVIQSLNVRDPDFRLTLAALQRGHGQQEDFLPLINDDLKKYIIPIITIMNLNQQDKLLYLMVL